MSAVAPVTPSAGVDDASPPTPLDRVLGRLASSGPLGAQVRTGMAWAALSKGGRQAIQLVSTVVLARLLLPEEFGLAALVTTVTGFAAIFVELGLGSAVVQAKRLTEDLLTTALLTSAVAGIVLALAVAGCSTLLAEHFEEPALRPLLLLASCTFLVQQATVPAALLQRSMRFRTLSWLEMGPSAVVVATTIVLASSGFGAASLVLGSLVGGLVTTVSYWAVVRWRPRGTTTRAELKRLVSFSGWVTGVNVINYWSRNADNMIVGGVLGFASLGFYSRAYNLMMMPMSQVTGVIGRVFLPAYSQLRDDPARLSSSWLLAARASLLVGIPASLGMCVTAGSLVELLYGRAWAPVAPVLALLAASVPARLLASTTGPVFQALGRTRLFFAVSTTSAVTSIASMFIGITWGLSGLATALLVQAYVSVLVTLFISCRCIGADLSQFLRAAAPLGLAGGVLCGASLGAATILPPGTPAAVELVVQAVSGGIAYAVAVLLLDRPLVLRVFPRLGRFTRR